MTRRFTKPFLRMPALHCGQQGQDVGRRARSASTDAIRCLARPRAKAQAASINSGSVVGLFKRAMLALHAGIIIASAVAEA